MVDLFAALGNLLAGGLQPWVPFAVTLIVLLVIRRVVLLLLPHKAHKRLPRQVALVVGAIIATIAMVLAVPIDNSLKQELLGLFGLGLTAIVALSSTTFAANAMAGLMLRSVKNFQIGDFVRVQEHFGKVSERGLLHTEIQTEDRDLLTLPNLYLITNPVKVVRASGTLVSCEVSLGYDVPRNTVSACLIKAAEHTGLSDGFVQTDALLDHAVAYRISGFLGDISSLVSTRSELRNQVLDALHGDGIEIVSPAFMNQRRLDGVQVLPLATSTNAPAAASNTPGSTGSDSLMFDKAEHAAKTKDGSGRLEALEKEINLLQLTLADIDPAKRDARQDDLLRLQQEAEALRIVLAESEQEDQEDQEDQDHEPDETPEKTGTSDDSTGKNS